MENLIGAIASVFSAIAAFASVFVAIVIWRAQSKQEKNSQQIAMFDKRYEIYQTVLRIIDFARFALLEDSTVTIPNHLVIADMVLTDYDLIKDGQFLVRHLSLQKAVKEGYKEERDKADRDLFYHDWDANNKLLHLKEKTLSIIKPSKFCFDEKVVNISSALVNEFFDYILIFKDGSAKEDKRDISTLEKCLNTMKAEKVIEKMEEYLSITK